MSEQRRTQRRVGPVSERDLQIYRLARSGTRTQRELAAEFQVSGPRIHAILARVHDLLCQREQALRERQLAAVLARHEERLEILYEETLRAWEESHQPLVTVRVTEVLGEVTSVTRTIKTQSGDPRWLTAAREIARRLADFRSQGNSRRAEQTSVVMDSSVVESQIVRSRVAAVVERANMQQIKRDSSEVSPK
jgi:hypothetical protein